MKQIRKVMALVLAAIMVLAMSAVSSFAAAADTTIKVESPVDGHTYTAYQLMVGDLATKTEGSTTTNILSNVKWGSNVASSINYKTKDNDGKFTVTATLSPKEGDAVPQAVLDYLESLSSDAQSTANIIGDWVTGTGTTISKSDATVKTGYYVVKDAYTDDTKEQTTTLSTFICKVVGPTSVTPKSGTTNHKKEVLDVSDTTDTALDLTKLKDVDANKWSTSADHDFGDKVPFKLTTTIGSDFAKYTNYYLAVTDTLKDGLVLDRNSIEVYVDGEKAIEGTGDGNYSVTKDNKSFNVEFTKLNGNSKAAAGKDVVIYYTATLDSDTAVIGNQGNWNESYAEFSNNPNGTQSGKGKTPTDTAVVFTYKTVVNKIDSNNNSLAGAEFTLTKTLKDGSIKAVSVVKYDKDGKVTTKTADGTTASEGDATKFEFKGLDDGTYTLTETVTPAGYNTVDPITFVVAAAHERSTATNDKGKVTSLTVKDKDGKDFSGEISFTAKADEGQISTNVVNNSGAELPETGGIGTTIFYILGALLVVGAGVLLVARRRMNAND